MPCHIRCNKAQMGHFLSVPLAGWRSNVKPYGASKALHAGATLYIIAQQTLKLPALYLYYNYLRVLLQQK